MIFKGETKCPKCGGDLYFYDYVKRNVKIEYGNKQIINLKRFICKTCLSVHREITNDILPYKHYKKEIIIGFTNGSLTNLYLEYEDYPSDSTIKRWVNTRKKVLLL